MSPDDNPGSYLQTTSGSTKEIGVLGKRTVVWTKN